MKHILIDKTGTIRAELQITAISENLFSGYIIKQYFSDAQLEVFKEFNELVSSQVLSLLDGIEAQIDSFGFKINDKAIDIFDLQIWNMKEFSFRKRSIENII